MVSFQRTGAFTFLVLKKKKESYLSIIILDGGWGKVYETWPWIDPIYPQPKINVWSIYLSSGTVSINFEHSLRWMGGEKKKFWVDQ